MEPKADWTTPVAESITDLRVEVLSFVDMVTMVQFDSMLEMTCFQEGFMLFGSSKF